MKCVNLRLAVLFLWVLLVPFGCGDDGASGGTDNGSAMDQSSDGVATDSGDEQDTGSDGVATDSGDEQDTGSDGVATDSIDAVDGSEGELIDEGAAIASAAVIFFFTP